MEIADKFHARTIEDLQVHVTFGKNCQRCHPYVQKMLETGQTVFEVIEETEETNR